MVLLKGPLLWMCVLLVYTMMWSRVLCMDLLSLLYGLHYDIEQGSMYGGTMLLNKVVCII